VIVLEGLLGSRICETSISEIVEIGDQTSELAPVDPNWVQLIFVVLRKRPKIIFVKNKISFFDKEGQKCSMIVF
jgi:hypothetical protein